MPPVIVARDLYKAYPGFPPVLRGVNIDVQPGEMAAIMGPSGCGKSTMLHVLGMLHKPDAGTLEILGQNVLAFNSEQTAAFRRGNMGFVMQASNLFEHSTVFENVEFPLIYENVPPQERWERVIRALDLVRLSARVHYRSNRLSGGEQQRVAIARAMVNNPRILLADEPTGALDARTSRVIMENFRNLCHNGGVAMVMVTHDPKMAEYCDSIYTLEDGLLHCQKHELAKVTVSAHVNFLSPPEPLVRGALTAWRFPSPANKSILQLASRMHGAGLLGRIYALAKNGLLAGEEGYALPLAVRRIGFWHKLFGFKVFFHRARGSASIWQLWKLLPKNPGFGALLRRLRAFSAGAILGRWGLADNIEFFFASGGRKESAAAWVAAKLLRLPFAFAVQPVDLPRLGKDCGLRARDAVFVTCSTVALREAFIKRFPQIPAEKVLLLPNPPLFASMDEEVDQGGMPEQKGRPADILAMSGKAARKILKAAAIMKKHNVPFRLTLLGKKQDRWLIRRLGLAKHINFVSREDRLQEDFRLADFFVALAPTEPGLDLGMPWPVCEAMYYGRPIVCLGLSAGMAPLENAKNCLVAANPEELASCLEKLMADRALASQLAAAARADIRNALDIEGATRQLADRIVMAAGRTNAKNAETSVGI